MLEKLSLFHLTDQITLVPLMWKLISLILKKNYLLRCWDSLSLLNWIWALTLSQLLKLPSRILESWFVLWHFFLLRLHFISVNLLHSRTWNTVVMARLVLLVASCICCINYRAMYVKVSRLQNSLPAEYCPLTYDLNG